MPATEITASVVICGYSDERRDQLRAALRSALSQSVPAREVIAVIDGNPALLATIAAEFPDVTVMENAGARGASGARNTGVRRASGDVVAFLDDDAVADRDWLARLLGHYAGPDVFAVGGAAHPQWPAERPRWFPREFDWVVGCTFLGQATEVASVRNLWGCNMSVRRDLFQELGGFLEQIGREGQDAAGCEETEICIRARQRFPGTRVIYDPAIAVRHFVSQQRTLWSYFRSRCIAEGRSKVQVVQEVGSGDGLSDERNYVIRTLPAGVLRGIGDTVLRFDPAGLARAGAIVAGLGFTAWGFLTAKRMKSKPAAPRFRPIRIVDVDVSRPLTPIAARDARSGQVYGGFFCLVRAAGKPVRIVEIPAQDTDVSVAQLTTLLADDLSVGAAPQVDPPPRAKAPLITVVVATRDRLDSLRRCLDSLLIQDYPRFDIVVVDSAPSSTATAEMIAADYAPTGLVRYALEERPGLGRAHNRGIEGLVAPIVAFTDDDVIVDRRWLSAIARNFELRDVGCVTGLILPAELETRAQFWTERHGAFGKGFARKIYDMREHRPPGPLFPFTAGQFGSGANMAYRSEALKKIGGFDSALGAGTIARSGDDLAAFFAIVHAGYQLVYEPEAIVWHHHRRDEEGMRKQSIGYGTGLGAYLTKIVVEEPALALRLARALPAGLAHMWGSGSERMQRLPSDYPAKLVWLERFGVLAGVPAYFRSRARLRGETTARPPEALVLPPKRSRAA